MGLSPIILMLKVAMSFGFQGLEKIKVIGYTVEI